MGCYVLTQPSSDGKILVPEAVAIFDIENVAGLILVWIELVGHKRTGIRRETAAIQLKSWVLRVRISISFRPPESDLQRRRSHCWDDCRRRASFT
jgi:hypothetical protein